MKDIYLPLPLVNNENLNRFELEVDGFIAYLEYETNSDGILALTHTVSPEELAGRGVATALIEKTFEYFKTNHLQFEPVCSMVIGKIKKEPKWLELVPEMYHSKINEK